MRVRYFVLLLALAIACLPRPAAADLPDVVKRYVDDMTLIVGRIDVTELSTDAIVAFMEELLREAPERERNEILNNMRQGLSGLDETLAPFREQELNTAYFIAGADTFVQDEQPLMVVPVADAEKARVLGTLLAARGQQYRHVEGAVLVGTPGAMNVAQGVQPVDRPRLSAGISNARNAPAFQLSFEPTPFVRFAAEMGAQELLNQTNRIPAGVVDFVADFEAVSFKLSLPPRPEMNVRVDFPTEESAESGREFIAEMVGMMQENFRRRLEPAMADQLLAALLPEAQGKRMVLELTPQEMRETIGPVMVLSMIRNHEAANRIRAGRNLRKLAQGVLLWSYEHGDGRLPEELALVEQVFTNPEADGTTWEDVRRNPRFGAEDAFAYVRPAERLDQIREPDITVIAYEKPPASGIREGVNVAFADGRVEWMSAKDFEELASLQKFEIEHLPR